MIHSSFSLWTNKLVTLPQYNFVLISIKYVMCVYILHVPEGHFGHYTLYIHYTLQTLNILSDWSF